MGAQPGQAGSDQGTGALDRADELRRLVAPSEGATDHDAAPGSAAIAALTASATRLASRGEAPAAGGRILVIDDQESNRLLLQDLLGPAGHEVYLAASGQAGLKLMRAIQVDLVLLDVLMEGMNGLDVLAAMREDAKLAELPVLMLSGLDDSMLIGQCLRAGALDFIRKPYDATILGARVAGTLERKRLRDRERGYLARLDEEKRRAEALLGNILPGAVIARLALGERTVADRFEAVTVLFADIVGFTGIAARLPAARLVTDLDRIVSTFDELAAQVGVEKIKTVGDAYLAAAGVPEPLPDHADRAAELALRMTEALGTLSVELGIDYRLRVGLHTGPVLAGVIGRRKFSYDVWGDTVNVASRLQGLAAPGDILLSQATRGALSRPFATTPERTLELRGWGLIESCGLVGRGEAG